MPAPVPAGLLLPGARDGNGARPAEGDREGLFSNAFIAMLLTERFVAGRSQNSLVRAVSVLAVTGLYPGW